MTALVPTSLVDLARTQAGLVSVLQAREHGLGEKAVRGLVRRGGWTRVTSGVVDLRLQVPTEEAWDHRRRRAAWAALLAFGRRAVAVGSCALALHRVAGLPGRIRPESALPGSGPRQSRDGLVVRQFDDRMDVVEVDGAQVASVAWALAQAVPELPRRNGLAVLDAALRVEPGGRHVVMRAHELARGRRGIAARHDLWELVDPRSESPLESFGRLECIEGGVAPDVLQLPLLDGSGRTVARGDMAWRRRDGGWLVAELDGHDEHSTPLAVFADRTRQNRWVMTQGVEVLRFTGRDLGTIARTVRRALSR